MSLLIQELGPSPISVVGASESTLVVSQSMDSDDFVAKAIEIVKKSVTTDDFNLIHTQIPKLAPSTGLSADTIDALIKQVKNVDVFAALLPTIYRHLIVDLHLQDKYGQLFNIPGFKTCNEEFRIACALLDAEKNLDDLCKNIQKYGIENQDILIEIAKRAVERRIPSLYKNIQNFGIKNQESLIEIAKFAGQHKGSTSIICSYLCIYIKNFGIESQEALIEIAELVAQKAGAVLSGNIKNFGIESQEALIEIAKLAAQQEGAGVLFNIKNYSIKNEKARFEIACIAIQKDPGYLVDRLQEVLDNCNLNLEHRIILFSRTVHLFPLFMQYADVFFPEKKIALEMSPELRVLGLSGPPFNISKFLLDFWEEENVPYDWISNPKAEYDAIDKETDLSAINAKLKWLHFYCCILSFARQSRSLLSKMIALLKELETEQNSRVKEQKMQWVAFLILNYRIQKVDAAILIDKWPLVEALLHLREPSLRFALIQPFIEMLIHPERAKEHNDKLPEHLQIISLLLNIHFATINGYSKSTKTVSFKERMVEVLNHKFFRKDKKQIKSLLRSLFPLIETPMLNNAEKGHILRDLIFVKDPHIKGKAQSEQCLLSAQIVAQLTECRASDRLKKLKTPQELREQVQDILADTLQLHDVDFNRKFFETFGKCRKPNALLTFVSKMQTLVQEEREEILPFLKLYVESVLNNTFFATRYDVSESASEHMIQLHTHAPKLLEAWKTGARFSYAGYDVEDTDDPYDLLLCGTESLSCQGVDQNPSLSKYLLSYLLDGKIRMMAVKNAQGVIIARCMLRLLWNKKTHKFVLFQEKLYPKNLDRFSKILENMCIQRAKQLGISLFSKNKVEEPSQHTALQAFKRKIPYEYVGALENALNDDCFQRSTHGYAITDASCVYEDEREHH